MKRRSLTGTSFPPPLFGAALIGLLLLPALFLSTPGKQIFSTLSRAPTAEPDPSLPSEVLSSFCDRSWGQLEDGPSCRFTQVLRFDRRANSRPQAELELLAGDRVELRARGELSLAVGGVPVPAQREGRSWRFQAGESGRLRIEGADAAQPQLEELRVERCFEDRDGLIRLRPCADIR